LYIFPTAQQQIAAVIKNVASKYILKIFTETLPACIDIHTYTYIQKNLYKYTVSNPR